jgi:LysM repeat protein
MSLKLKRFSIKLLIYILKGSAVLKKGLVFIFKFLRKPLAPVWTYIYKTLFFFYKIYFFFRRFIVRIFPAKTLLAITTNKYLVHAAIVIIALATVSQNLYAQNSTLGDYGKNSILFKLTTPIDEQDETVAGLPINSDIEQDAGAGQISPGGNLNITQSESLNVLGFIGGDQAPSVGTESTRTNIEYYVVQKGDTLGSIAESFGIGLETLLWSNKLTARSYIRPGEQLTILPVNGVSHTVKKGDTLQSIAKKYTADIEKIREFNRLSDSDTLSVGQVIIVPGGKIIPVAAAPATYSSGYTASKTYASSGALLWPVLSRRVTQYFSWRHPGLDVGLPTGSTVVAAEAGTVIYSGWGTGYGWEVLIDHGNGLKTRYGHNSRLLVKKGDQVERGQTISMSGNTGWSTGPHLHFEVYSGTARQNPLLYIK